MSQNDPYFQFPLSCLAFGKDPIERLRHIVNFCCATVGTQKSAAMTIQEMTELVNAMPEDDQPSGIRMNSRDSMAVVIGMLALRIRQGNVETVQDQHDLLLSFCNNMASRHGASPLVRIRNDLVWDAIHGRLPYRSFAVLCAVYCVIGRNAWPVRITRDRIIAGALGYKTPRMLTDAVLKKRQDGACLLTVNQVRYTLDKLEGASLFVRVQLSPRRVYFSNRMTREEMADALFKNATNRKIKLATHRKGDRELQARIKNAIIAVNPQMRAPAFQHEDATESPKSHHEVTTII